MRNDDFDILNLSEDEWEHFQIMDQLHRHKIDHFFVDVFMNDFAWILGCRVRDEHEIAKALNVPSEILYYDSEHGVVFINLWQLRALRQGFRLEDD